MYVRRVLCGDFAICEGLPTSTFLQTPYDEWLWIRDRHVYSVQSDGIVRRVIFCQLITYEEVKLLNSGVAPIHVNRGTHVPEIVTIFGRCEASMRFLDTKHRDYVNTLVFKKGDVLAIKSVAGSGKTTTLLKLAEANKNKRILYLAFNKSLIEEIRRKATPNLYPRTFDSLLYNIISPRPTNIMDIKPHTVSKIVPWLANKPWKMKQKYASLFEKFCNQIEFDSPEMFTQKPEKLLVSMWDSAVKGKFQSFGTIRKMCHDKRLCNNVLDEQYDMIFIDESQDFDLLMLSILLRDTTIPKIFVGDPKQAIYQWRGAIDAFNWLPEHTNVVEFYTSFRVGEPACSMIREQFDDCWMISGTVHDTTLVYDDSEPPVKYTYLFRTWKGLLQTARKTKNIWINDFDKQSCFMRNLSDKLNKFDLSEDERSQFSDDLPSFLLKLKQGELDEMLDDIESNIVHKDISTCEMYTIHAYKGLEDDVIKVHDDLAQEDANIRYVALTRGRVKINVCN